MIRNKTSPYMNEIHVCLLPWLYCERSFVADASKNSSWGALPIVLVLSHLLLIRGTSAESIHSSLIVSHAMAGAVLGALNINSSVTGLSQCSIAIVKVLTCTAASR